MVSAINIAGRQIGGGAPCFIIAEAGVNHNGDLAMARRLVEAAAAAGADAVKFQTFKAERLLAPDAPKAEYQKRTTGAVESQFQMIKKLELSKEAHRDLMRHCQDKDILFMSSPFDELSADFLDSLGVEVYKIPSGEITNIGFLQHVADKGKPMIVSTGMSNLGEVEEAVRTIEASRHRDYVLLQCVSNYPADAADANLNAMRTMSLAFDALVGYSDHTLGVEVPLAAVALGACVIEKHLTLDKTLAGPDHQASMEPEEFAALVQGIRTVEAALGHGEKIPAASETDLTSVARKSLAAAQDIPAGTIITEELITVIRPGTGMPPAMRSKILGRSTRVTILAGTLLSPEMISS